MVVNIVLAFAPNASHETEAAVGLRLALFKCYYSYLVQTERRDRTRR